MRDGMMKLKVIGPDEASVLDDFFGRNVRPPDEVVAFVAVVALDDDVPVAVGTVEWNRAGECWGHFDAKRPLSPFMMHRVARRMLGVLADVGETAVHAAAHPGMPGAAKWLSRLGFAPHLNDEGQEYWKWQVSKS